MQDDFRSEFRRTLFEVIEPVSIGVVVGLEYLGLVCYILLICSDPLSCYNVCKLDCVLVNHIVHRPPSPRGKLVVEEDLVSRVMIRFAALVIRKQVLKVDVPTPFLGFVRVSFSERDVTTHFI